MFSDGQPRPNVPPVPECVPDRPQSALKQESIAVGHRAVWRRPVATRFGLERTLCFAGSAIDMLHTGRGGC